MPGRLASLVFLAALFYDGGAAGLAQGRAAPVIHSVAPRSGPVGTKITITGANFTAANNTIRFGGGVIQWLPASSGGGNQTIVFTLRPVIGAIACPGAARCPTAAYFVQPGGNPVSVQNANGTSNTTIFTVTN
ncbi:MAG TPA: IPT/TIG domain-containing protein [Stellaceae bacterium]|nr:IPT/TIG domain-containing protein [Stellaceae bacterium]